MTKAHGYPRPQLRRAGWLSLNGPWDFALDPQAQWTRPSQVAQAATITVPFAPEISASRIDVPPLRNGERLMLHFGAVDYAAAVWPEEKLLGRHEGGHTPFSFDLTEVIAGSEQIERRYEMDEVLAGSSLGSVRVVAC